MQFPMEAVFARHLFDDLVTMLTKKPMDPYLLWAMRTAFRQFTSSLNGSTIQLSFLVELEAPFVQASWSARHPELAVAVAYTAPLGSGGHASTFVTVRFDADWKSSAQSLRLLLLELLNCPLVKRVQLGFPRGLPQVSPKPALDAPSAPSSTSCPKVVIGVIDDGCVFAHAHLSYATGNCTRVAAFWSQTTTTDYTLGSSHWRAAADFDYGAIMYQQNMDDHSSNYRQDGDVDEPGCYQHLFSGRLRNLLFRESHGAAVTLLASGNRFTDGAVANDEASKAPIIFVDLPREQVEISSGRWLPVNGLDACRFIIQEAKKLRKESALPVVINLSSGSGAGPHDGSAMFERAMDELLAADENLAIVLAAGNSRMAESHYAETIASRSCATVELFVPALKPFETMVEVWFDLQCAQDASAIEIKLFTPGGALIANCLQNTACYFPSNELAVAGVAFLANPVQTNRGRTMALISVAATAVHDEYVFAPSGQWRIEIINDSPRPMSFDAWIERDEVVFGARRPQSARFIDPACDDLQPFWRDSGHNRIRRDGTLSNIATGAHTIAVAAGTGAGDNGYVSRYSSEPPLMNNPPTHLPFVATADAHAARWGILADGNIGGARRHFNGSSAAAPQVTRYVANQMALGNTRSSILNTLVHAPARDHPFRSLDNQGGAGVASKAPGDGCQSVAYASWADRVSPS